MDQDLTLTAAQLRELDTFAIEGLGLPGIVLMENAGRNAAEHLVSVLRAQNLGGRRPPPPWKVSILCGRGGNGGDGYVVARHLANAGHDVEVLSVALRERLAGDAAVERTVCERLGLRIVSVGDGAAWSGALARLEHCDAIVDGLLGVGSQGAPREPVADVLRCANASRLPFKLALDLPSGLDADSGAVAGECFVADLTVTFVARKLAFSQPAAARFCGRIVVADIGVTPRRRA